MSDAAQAYQADAVTDQLFTRIDELERDKAILATRLDEAETKNARMRQAVKRARVYAGDNLPAAPGLEVIIMLEKALKESKS